MVGFRRFGVHDFWRIARLKTRFRFVLLCLMFTALSGQAGTFKDGPFTAYVFGDDVADEDFAFGWQAAYPDTRLVR